MAKWSNVDEEQLKEAPPSTCRYCLEPIYWEKLKDVGNKVRPVDADTLESHNCAKRPVRGAGR